jgi:ABC-2 type transport system permease protein
MIVMFPIIIMCVIPWVTNLEVKNINIKVVDNDRSTISSRLIHRIESSRYFKFQGLSPSYKDAMDDVERGNTDIILEIPHHYAHDKEKGLTPKVFISANAVNGTKGGMGSGYITYIVAQNLGIYTESKITTLSLFNPHKDYKVYMIPALMALLIVMMCGFMPALNIVGEKETGTIEQINVTPVSKLTFILAKLIPYWIIALFIMTVCFLLSWAIYGIVPAGNIILLYMLAILLTLIFSGMGLVVSNYSDAMQQAMFVMWFIMVCMMLLSGLFTPVRSMPNWAQTLTLINPLRYFIEAMRTVFIKGGDFYAIFIPTIALSTFAVIMDTWAVISYKKNR